MDEFNNQNKDEDLKQEEPDSPQPEVHLPGYNKINPKISPITAAFIGLLGGFFLYQIIGGLITLLIFGFNLDNAPINSVRLMTMASQILFLLLPALILSKVFYEDVTTIIRFHFPKMEEVLFFMLGLIVLIPLLQYYLSIQTYAIKILSEHSAIINSIKKSLDDFDAIVNKTYSSLLSAHTILDVVLVIIVATIVPAVCEETLFRGFIQKSFEFKFKQYFAAGITAVFFAVYHFNPYAIVPLFILGFYFGFAAYKSNSIFIPFALHFFFNFTSVVLYFIFGDDNVIDNTVNKNFDIKSEVFILLSLIIIFSGVIYMIRKYYSKRIKS